MQTNGVTAGDVTGSVVFSSTNGPISTNAVSGGSATSASLTSLPRGTNVITAVYSGDNNYIGSSSTLNQVVTNHPPVASQLTVTRASGISLKVALGNLATNWTDVDGDTISFVSASASTNGVAITTNGGFVLYDNTNNVDDRFNYVIIDSYGETAIGVVDIVVDSSGGSSQSQNIVGLVSNNDGSKTISFAGIPNYSYRVQATTSLVSPLWTDVSTNVAGTNGLWQFTDLDATNYPARYYRTVHP